MTIKIEECPILKNKNFFVYFDSSLLMITYKNIKIMIYEIYRSKLIIIYIKIKI